MRHFGWLRSLLGGFARSGRAIFVCSLAAGMALAGSSLVCLEVLDERRDRAYSGGSPSGTMEEAEDGGRAAARPETTKAEPVEDTRERPELRGEAVREEGGSGPARSRTTKETRETRETSSPENREPDDRELEAELDEIAARYPGEYGIVMWQPGSGTRATVDSRESFSAASLAKLPVLLALYREAAEGRLSLDERIEVSASDIRPGTGVLQDEPPGTTMTLRECAEYLMKESDNTAWKMLENRLGEQRIQSELARAGADSTRYEYARHTTTPDDTLKLLQRISDPAYTSPEHSREMLSAMTHTSFEGRLPRGLPADARISHKIGTLGTSFGDAGIVFPPEDEGSSGPYYVVVLSKNTSEAAARNAMQEISLSSYRAFVDPEARPRHTPLEASLASREEQARGEQPE